MSTTAIGFVWSLYVAPMCELRGATAESMAAVYSGLALTGALLTIIGGKLVDKFGASKVILSAIIAFAIGHIITGMTTNFWGFALPKLTLISWQQSVVYIAIYTNVVKTVSYTHLDVYKRQTLLNMEIQNGYEKIS